jgi:surface antigen
VTDSEFAAPPSSDPSDGSATPGFSSRREMREAGGYAPIAGSRTVVARRTRRGATGGRDAVRSSLAKRSPSRWRRRLSSAGVMTLVVGLFASLTFPAFADQNSLTEDTAPLAGQELEITAATTDQSEFIRDSYGTTNAADLRKMYADAIRQQNLAAYLASGAREMGDDYPWPDQLTINQGGGLSPFNYYYRECVDFVAWRMNRDAGVTSAPWKWVWSNLAQGSAWKWKSEWIRHGWATGTTPEVGAVAWYPGGNHVAYVSGILPDGSVVIEEYNWGRNHAYGQRIIPANSVYYLYAPPA